MRYESSEFDNISQFVERIVRWVKSLVKRKKPEYDIEKDFWNKLREWPDLKDKTRK